MSSNVCGFNQIDALLHIRRGEENFLQFNHSKLFFSLNDAMKKNLTNLIRRHAALMDGYKVSVASHPVGYQFHLIKLWKSTFNTFRGFDRRATDRR